MTPHADEYRVHVGSDYGRWGGVAVTITARNGTQIAIGLPTEMMMQDVPDSGVYPDAPTMRIPDNLGRALLEALSAHYGGIADLQEARRDLNLERKRVDKLLDVVSTIATARSQAVP